VYSIRVRYHKGGTSWGPLSGEPLESDIPSLQEARETVSRLSTGLMMVLDLRSMASLEEI